VPRYKDTDFLYLSAMVRELENHLISAEQLDRMIRADSDQEAVRVLEECGYGQVDVTDAMALDRAFALKMAETLHELANRSPEEAIVDAFRIKYDYHNAKVLVKAEAADVDGDSLLSDGGRVPRRVFEESYYEERFSADAPQILADATLAAHELLNDTGDAQAADILLDHAMYREYLALAEQMDDAFFTGYVRLMIDGVNLRTAVRAVRMGLGPDALLDVLIPGGDVPPVEVIRTSNFKNLYASTPLEPAAKLAREAMDGSALTAFEREADNAIRAYLGKAKFVAFGIAPVIAYMAALESEAMAVRIVMASRGAGLSPEAIRERLRD